MFSKIFTDADKTFLAHPKGFLQFSPVLDISILYEGV